MPNSISISTPRGHSIFLGRVAFLYEARLLHCLQAIAVYIKRLGESQPSIEPFSHSLFCRLNATGQMEGYDPFIYESVTAILNAMPQQQWPHYRGDWLFVLADYELFVRTFLISEGGNAYDCGNIGKLHTEPLNFPGPKKDNWFRSSGDPIADRLACLSPNGRFDVGWQLMGNIDRHTLDRAVFYLNQGQIPEAERMQSITMERRRAKGLDKVDEARRADKMMQMRKARNIRKAIEQGAPKPKGFQANGFFDVGEED